MVKQHTIARTISLEGVGLHSGKPVKITLNPAAENTGIRFQRLDLPQQPTVTIAVDAIRQEPMCTALVDQDVRIATIEHLMAALAGLAVDNVLITLNAPEIPIMDGSSAPFVFALESASVVAQSAKRKTLVIQKPVKVTDGDRWAQLEPAKQLSLSINFSFEHPAVDFYNQHFDFTFDRACFVKLIARARTFGKASDLAYLHQNKLALGASLDNAIGLGDEGVMNPEGLRFKDEFIRHKVLDAIGDLYVAGPILGHFSANNPGHALNNALLRAVLADDSAFVWG